MKNRSKFAPLAPSFRRNLRKLARTITDADKREGLAWYPLAVSGARKWSEGLGIDARTIACVIAAISPQCDWTSNLRIALEVLAGQTIVTGGALRRNVEIARRVLADGAVSLDGYFANGPKVSAFSRNLMGDSDAVTVDTHAVQAVLNNPTYARGVKPAQYPIVADAYRTVARELGYRPCDFQAVIWCAWKRRHTTVAKRAAIARAKRAGKDRNRGI